MNNKNILITAIAFALILAGLFLYSVRLQLEADSLIGFGTVLSVLAIVAVDYRLNLRRPLGE